MECKTCGYEHPQDAANADGRPYSDPNFCIARMSETMARGEKNREQLVALYEKTRDKVTALELQLRERERFDDNAINIQVVALRDERDKLLRLVGELRKRLLEYREDSSTEADPCFCWAPHREAGKHIPFCEATKAAVLGNDSKRNHVSAGPSDVDPMERTMPVTHNPKLCPGCDSRPHAGECETRG